MCFLVNAASYVAVIVALMLMRRVDLHPAQRVARAKGQLREGLRYAWRTPNLRDPLLLVFVVGLLAYNFTVILPLLAQEHLPRRGRDVRAAHLAHGRRGRGGGADRGQPGQAQHPPADRRSASPSAC